MFAGACPETDTSTLSLSLTLYQLSGRYTGFFLFTFLSKYTYSTMHTDLTLFTELEFKELLHTRKPV